MQKPVQNFYITDKEMRTIHYELNLFPDYTDKRHYATWKYDSAEVALIELARLADDGTKFQKWDMVQVIDGGADANLIGLGRFGKAIDFELLKSEIKKYTEVYQNEKTI